MFLENKVQQFHHILVQCVTSIAARRLLETDNDVWFILGQEVKEIMYRPHLVE